MDKGLPVSDSGVIMEGGLDPGDIIMAVQIQIQVRASLECIEK